MTDHPIWYYDELTLSGVDYQDAAQVAAYDRRHQRFRDYERATAAILKRLDLGPAHTVIDMGAGTGAFVLHATPHLKHIYAVDISRPMLDFCQGKIAEAGLDNVTFHHGGFLTYEHAGDPVDAMVSVAVLHHLPDFWKFVALTRAAQMIRPGGKLHLFDIVFPAAMYDYTAQIDRWVTNFTAQVGAEFANEIVSHMRDEYSTFDWVMETLLRQAGFVIERATYAENFSATYLCSRP